ncbi:MAG: glycosyltransferase family 4 protein [Patescibacteria group bacterium]|nr:glycosyltransferase family 4 protein [Patescibacteria group bacterium]
MKIAIDARFYRKSTGGIGRYTRALLLELSRIDGKNQYTIFLTSNDKLEYDIKAKNFTVRVIDIKHYSISEQTKFLKILNQGKFDLVHFTNFNHPILYKKKFIATIHDLTLMLYPGGKYSLIKKAGFKLVITRAVKNAARVISVSEATKQDLINVLSAGPGKIEVIYEGIDDNYNVKCQMSNVKTIEILKKYNISKPYLLFISQWRPHKGIIQLVEAFKILKEKYTIPHQLVIVGKPIYNFPEIPYTIHHTPYTKDIVTPGFVAESDLPILYQNADIFVFPSHYEGFGLPPLEAMACGVPVAASNVSCIPEILGKAAIYFDPYEPADIAQKIQKIITEPNLRKKLIQDGVTQSKKYSWHKMAKETLALYRKILNQIKTG